MRKDVKLGFAIGGILLAVMIVYATAISGNDPVKKPAGVSLVTTGDQGQSGVAQARADSRAPVVEDPAPITTSTPMLASAVEGSRVRSAPDWDRLLETGAPPVLMSTAASGQQPPTDTVAAEATESPSPVVQTPSTGVPTAPVEASQPQPQAATPVPPVVAIPTREEAPAPSNNRKYTIKSGDSFYTIASDVYGNSHYYPHLLRANPGIDPGRLKVGMVVNLPDPSAVKPAQPVVKPSETASRDTRSDRTNDAADLNGEYTVRENDTLYTISKRIFGTTKRMQDIYALNRSVIGSDPGRLKVGTTLKLPANKTAEASAR